MVLRSSEIAFTLLMLSLGFTKIGDFRASWTREPIKQSNMAGLVVLNPNPQFVKLSTQVFRTVGFED